MRIAPPLPLAFTLSACNDKADPAADTDLPIDADADADADSDIALEQVRFTPESRLKWVVEFSSAYDPKGTLPTSLHKQTWRAIAIRDNPVNPQ